MDRAWVVNASPLIALGRIDSLDLISALAPAVLVPDSVADEVEAGLDKDRRASLVARWSGAFRIPGVAVPQSVAGWDLGVGETQVLALCLQSEGRVAVLDDREARRCALSLGLGMIGTLGILLRSKREGLVSEVRPLAERLAQAGYYLDRSLVESVLAKAGE